MAGGLAARLRCAVVCALEVTASLSFRPMYSPPSYCCRKTCDIATLLTFCTAKCELVAVSQRFHPLYESPLCELKAKACACVFLPKVLRLRQEFDKICDKFFSCRNHVAIW